MAHHHCLTVHGAKDIRLTFKEQPDFRIVKIYLDDEGNDYDPVAALFFDDVADGRLQRAIEAFNAIMSEPVAPTMAEAFETEDA